MERIKTLKFSKNNGFETTQKRSQIMKKIKPSNTKPELLLRRRLWSEGFRYRVNYEKLPGKPDIIFLKNKIAVFVDGSFWLGHNWDEKKKRLKTNKKFWVLKIERNMQRDEENNKRLQELGWKVLRFWDHEIQKNIDSCIEKVKESHT